MVDRAKRDILAEKLRHLLSGRIDNLQFDTLDEGDVLNSEDRVLREVFQSMWFFYDDFRSHPIRLTDGQRLDFVRAILFLHSDLEFEWPSRRNLPQGIFHWLVNVFALTRTSSKPPIQPVKGDRGVFPFYRRSDYECALKNPRLLVGAT